jgi:hypothetical protein
MKTLFKKILPIGWKNNTKNVKPNFPYFIIFTTLKTEKSVPSKDNFHLFIFPDKSRKSNKFQYKIGIMARLLENYARKIWGNFHCF